MLKHKHHIIPKHMGGSDDSSNIVHLTVEEHAEAHKKLYDEFGRWQDLVAWKGLSGRIGKEDIIRLTIIESNKARSGEFAGDKNPSKRPEVRDKISKALRGRVSPTKGMVYTEETKKKQSESGKDWWETHPIEAEHRRKKLIENNIKRKKNGNINS